MQGAVFVSVSLEKETCKLSFGQSNQNNQVFCLSSPEKHLFQNFLLFFFFFFEEKHVDALLEATLLTANRMRNVGHRVKLNNIDRFMTTTLFVH